MVAERQLFRELTGKARSARTAAKVTATINAFFRCYTADYERGELTWVDALYAMAASGDPAVTWRLDVPPTHEADGAAAVTLRIPVVALEAAGLLAGALLLSRRVSATVPTPQQRDQRAESLPPHLRPCLPALPRRTWISGGLWRLW